MRAPRRLPAVTCEIDDFDLAGFTQEAAEFGQTRFGYVVTPNADHLLRLHRDPAFVDAYAQAEYVLFDSRFLARIIRLTRGLSLPVCTGSDLTASLLSNVIQAEDRLVMIGGSDAQARALADRYGLRHIAHHNPPMGFIRKPAAFDAALDFVEAHSPFRFCFLAVGAPQQELFAQALKRRGRARGLALCIGASLDFLTGKQKRAPQWLQALGLECVFRLLSAPQRMARRYLVGGPVLLALLSQTDFRLRTSRQLHSSRIVVPARG